MQTNNKKKNTSKIQIINTLVLIVIAILLFCIFWSLNKTFRQFVYHESITGIRFYNIAVDTTSSPISVSLDHLWDAHCTSKFYIFNIQYRVKLWEYPKNLMNKPKRSLQETCSTNYYSEPGEFYNYPQPTYIIRGLFEEYFIEPKDFKESNLTKQEMLEYLSEKHPDTYQMIHKSIQRKELLDYMVETKTLPNTLEGLSKQLNE